MPARGGPRCREDDEPVTRRCGVDDEGQRDVGRGRRRHGENDDGIGRGVGRPEGERERRRRRRLVDEEQPQEERDARGRRRERREEIAEPVRRLATGRVSLGEIEEHADGLGAGEGRGAARRADDGPPQPVCVVKEGLHREARRRRGRRSRSRRRAKAEEGAREEQPDAVERCSHWGTLPCDCRRRSRRRHAANSPA